MAERKTEILLYGVELSYEQAINIHAEIGYTRYKIEKETGFKEVLAKWNRDSTNMFSNELKQSIDEYSLEYYYNQLLTQTSIETYFSETTTIHHFFDYCDFANRQVDISDLVHDTDCGYYPYRYFSDFFSIDADIREDSLRFKPKYTSIYSIYIASRIYYADWGAINDTNFPKESVQRNFNT